MIKFCRTIGGGSESHFERGGSISGIVIFAGIALNNAFRFLLSSLASEIFFEELSSGWIIQRTNGCQLKGGVTAPARKPMVISKTRGKWTQRMKLSASNGVVVECVLRTFPRSCKYLHIQYTTSQVHISASARHKHTVLHRYNYRKF